MRDTAADDESGGERNGVVGLAELGVRHNMGIHIPGYLQTGTHHVQVPAYVIPMGSTTCGSG